ncbi:hypothetical protein R1sor_002540 [Riccia sorocarpa]|uniref:Cytochrome P450 n=1 Tax=Riccia sorocarpa TaxID=122646 RepID=A0ABD3GZX7_9MARC
MPDSAGNTLLVLGLATCVLVYLWIYRWRQGGRVGPKAWPLIGSLLEIRANAHRVHDWMYDYMSKSPTGTFSFKLPPYRFISVGRPDNVEYILKTNFSNYIKGPMFQQHYEDLMGNGIFVADGDVWRQHRKIASYEFSSEKLRESSTEVYRVYALHLMLFLETIADSERQVDIQDLFLRMTMGSICKIAFGVDQHMLSPELPEFEFATVFDTLTMLTVKRSLDPFWKVKRKLNVGREKKFRALRPVVEKFTYDVIRLRRAELAELEAMGKTLEKQDLLSRFMSAKDANGESLSDKVLRDAVLNFLIAGRDTSASTLSWFVYLLCVNPEVAKRCFQEIQEVFGDEQNDLGQGTDRFYQFGKLLTYESLGRLHYLHAAISETLRLYPPVARSSKVASNQSPDSKHAVKDDILPDGTVVKAGERVVYVPYSMGRLELVWGPDAWKYRPERWLKDGCYKAESPFKFSVFQAGPRICLGKDTAYLQMLMTSAMFIRWFHFELVPNQSVTYKVSLILAIKNGLKVFARHR